MNIMPCHRIFLLVLLSSLLAASCRKTEDAEFPVIVVTAPLPGSVYENGDTIRFRAEFSDNVRLSSVELSLVDPDNKPMLSNLSIVPDKSPFTFQGEYIINDPLLPGGTFQLRFRASDGVNVTNHFIEIQVHELSRQLLYPLLVTHPSTGIWSVYRLKTDDTWTEIFTQTGDYGGSAVNSAESQLYMCGIYQSDLTAVKLPTGLPLWHVKAEQHQSQRWFEGIVFCYPDVYASVAEGNIRAYNKTGNQIYKTDTYANEVPQQSVATRNFVVASFRDAFSTDRFLVTFHNPGGKMISTRFFLGDVVGIFCIGADKVIVFSNSNGQGVISLYNASENTITPLNGMYESGFRETAMLDTDYFLMTGSSGLYWYCLSTNSLIPFVSKTFNNIACDNTSRLIFASNGKNLEVYSFPYASLEHSYPLPDTTVNLHLVFNK